MLPTTIDNKKPRTKVPLVLQDESHLTLVADPKLAEMFQAERKRVEETLQAIRTLSESGPISPGDQAVYHFYHGNLALRVSQLTAIVMEQIKLHEAVSMQTAAEMQEAMDATAPTKARRGKRGAAIKRKQSQSQPPQRKLQQQQLHQ